MLMKDQRAIHKDLSIKDQRAIHNDQTTRDQRAIHNDQHKFNILWWSYI